MVLAIVIPLSPRWLLSHHSTSLSHIALLVQLTAKPTRRRNNRLVGVDVNDALNVAIRFHRRSYELLHECLLLLLR